MKLIDIILGPWAIQPEKLTEIQAIYGSHLRGEKLDWKGMQTEFGAAISRNADQRAGSYYMIGDVAVVPIEGALAKKANLFMAICGGASYQLVEQEFRAAMADPMAKAVILDIDSPGGAVDGVQELSQTIFAARGTKPVVALANGLMASAAYYVGSAADSIYMASDMTLVGSIGVVAQHMDVSAQEASRGVKTTEITAGKYKRIASQFESLSQEGRASIQDQVDQMYSTFVQDVAKFRGQSVETVLEEMADGRIFIGKQAIDAGLVDGVSTLNQLAQMLSDGALTSGQAAVSAATTTSKQGAQMGGLQGVAAKKNATDDEEKMGKGKAAKPLPNDPDGDGDDDSDPSKNPDAPEDEEEKKGSKKSKKSSADSERERIQGVLSLSRPGYEGLVNRLAFDGETTKAEAAEAILAAMDSKSVARAKAFEADAPAPMPVNGAPADTAMAIDGATIGSMATKLIAEEKAKGITLSADDAVARVTQQLQQKGA